jgi:hypothetical protein
LIDEISKFLGCLPGQSDIADEFEKRLCDVSNRDASSILSAFSDQLTALFKEPMGPRDGFQLEPALVELLNHIQQAFGRSELVDSLLGQLNGGRLTPTGNRCWEVRLRWYLERFRRLDPNAWN